MEEVERDAGPRPVARPLVLLERGEGEGGRRDGERKRRVDDVEPGERDDEERGRDDQSREESDPFPVSPAGEEDRDEDHPRGRELHRGVLPVGGRELGAPQRATGEPGGEGLLVRAHPL